MQNNNSWQVIAEGVIESHGAKESIVIAVSKTFRIDGSKAQQLLDGKVRTIKKNIPRSQAEKYRSILIELGVKASIRQMPDVVAPVSPISSPASAPSTNSLAGLTLEPMVESLQVDDPAIAPVVTPIAIQGFITCPKCHTKQKPADECKECGVIIARYRQKVNEAQDALQDVPDDHEPPHGLSFLNSLPKIYLAIAAVIVFIGWKFFLDSGDYLPVGNNSHAVAQRGALTESFSKPHTDLQHLRSLVESERYAEAEKIVQELQDKVLIDILWEETYQDTLDGISAENKFSLASLNDWISQSGSAIAYLARGAYFVTEGINARGKRFAKDTTQEQFAKEEELHELGIKDLHKALVLDPQLFPAYTFLLMTASSATDTSKDWMDKAARIAPGGYYFRYQYLRSLMPKWGGSYAEMNEFADSLESLGDKNPRLWLLKGFALAEEAHTAMHADKFNKAISLYSEALQFGIARDWLTKRAYALEMEGEDKKALADINLVLEIYRTSNNAEQLRMKAHLEQKL
ncbi:hypothetical protein GCM10011613_03950 [Cellvibrio zantedeschiae]|uniref:Uncharacterized protein n=1 Tax=Cellvibrio zantedeschiae TaxID=1237077 RepID=A0ABQ3AR86_9GAMM|nr:DUF4034 domain-containing protein [Cellvibrio zantedeschiae]GGY63455.1 hypothetical protein GCM10011613_03950 [Cellvibrio zantedeschiae]